MLLGMVTPASAEITDLQTSPYDDLTYDYMSPGMDIQFVQFARTSEDSSVWLFFVQMRGLLANDQFAGYSEDFIALTIDADNDGSNDFFLTTPSETVYPDSLEGVPARILNMKTYSLMPECKASTWKSDDSKKDPTNPDSKSWVGFKLKKSCLNLSTRFSVEAASAEGWDRDFTDRFTFTTSKVQTVPEPNPALAHLEGHGPKDGEFSAWTKVLENGRQMKFYAKYLQPGHKIQFMLQNSKGVYEEVAWHRVDYGDLDENGGYRTLQNHVYFIRTIDLKPGKNRVRILVDGEIIWGTKTYTVK